MSSEKPVGASYMAQWDLRPDDERLWRRDMWEPIRLLPDLIPLKGCYDETLQDVMDQSIREAVWGRLDYFVFDTFFDHATGKFTGDHAMVNFMASEERGLKFAISLDTRNSEIPFTTLRDWENFCDLLPAYIDDPRYLTRNGRGVLFLISFQHMHQDVAGRLGQLILDKDGLPVVPLTTPNYRATVLKELLKIAKTRTGCDLYWAAGVEATEHWMWQLDVAGFDGHWFYNMFTTQFGPTPSPWPANYADLDTNYRAVWQWLLRLLKRATDTSGTELWLSLSAGWDNQHLVGARPTEAQWEAHCAFAKGLGDIEPKVVGYVIDAWNEHREGSVLEPIKKYGRMMLSVVRRVFG